MEDKYYKFDKKYIYYVVYNLDTISLGELDTYLVIVGTLEANRSACSMKRYALQTIFGVY